MATLALVGVLRTGSSQAQVETAQSLAERSAIVVRGTVVRLNASEEPLQAASAGTVVIKVSRMYAGAEIAGDQTGRNATVILSRPGELKAGAEAMFFGNPRFVGKSLTIVDVGEILSSAPPEATAGLEVGLQARRDLPVRERLAAASLVFRGKVESEGPLVPERKYKSPPSEHDPDWHVAQVRIITPLRGGDQGALVIVIFPASRDIMWANSPKLEPGLDAIFIAHKPEREFAQLYRTTGVTEFLQKQPAELVTHPFDVLPGSDDARVRRLLKEVQ
ncbi:MAG: hypothetical protein LAO31_10085 [Acidobacteriia bacterium]|nr:hypothetical protein [Terriglobia bacterium]